MSSSLSTLQHLRLPFSFFLLPVFLFAVALSPAPHLWDIVGVFVLLHFLVYPASNGYNSYFDKDEGAIGLVEKPLPVTKELYYVSVGMDLVATLWALWWGWPFALMVLVYGLASKAYSHPSFRWKKYPWGGWFVAGFFQGFFTYLMVWTALNGFSLSGLLKVPELLAPATLCSLFLWGSYPMTQVYQHEEDSERGDRTLSLILGVRGTFLFTLAAFGFAILAFQVYFFVYLSPPVALFFLLFLGPVLVFFLLWMRQVWKKEEAADFHRTMWLNLISSVCLNAFFAWLWLS